MEAQGTTTRITPRLVFGLAVMTFGLVLTADTMGFVDARNWIHTWWPLFMIALGLVKLIQPPGCRQGAGFWILAGTALLASNLGFLRLRNVIPVAILLVGARIVWRSLVPPSPVRGRGGSTLDAFAFMGGVHRVPSSLDRGGQATAIMGGVELDLRQLRDLEGEFVLDTFAFWGGIDVWVPEDWEVVTRGLPVMGGFEDKSRHPATPRARLVVTGIAFMGGVSVSNGKG